MAYKVFSNGDALTGSELNTYLMNQSVMVFASTTARDAALTAPTEGMVVWLQDSNKYVYYTGSAWADLITPASSGNAIINGAFDIWQRGTSFTASDGVFTADRWVPRFNGSGATRTITRETFTPGAAPVAGLENPYFYRWNQTVAGTSGTYNIVATRIEDVRTFAGQSVTVSFYAKAGASATLPKLVFDNNFGSGGSASVQTTIVSSVAITTSWARYTATVSMPSVSGKTIGASSYVELQIWFPENVTGTYDIWGVQLESGSTATAFKRNAPSIQAELAACQRYYWRSGQTQESLYAVAGTGHAGTTTSITAYSKFPVNMRTKPTSVAWQNVAFTDLVNAFVAFTTLTLDGGFSSTDCGVSSATVSGATAFRPYWLTNTNNSAGYVAYSAEL